MEEEPSSSKFTPVYPDSEEEKEPWEWHTPLQTHQEVAMADIELGPVQPGNSSQGRGSQDAPILQEATDPQKQPCHDIPLYAHRNNSTRSLAEICFHERIELTAKTHIVVRRDEDVFEDADRRVRGGVECVLLGSVHHRLALEAKQTEIKEQLRDLENAWRVMEAQAAKCQHMLRQVDSQIDVLAMLHAAETDNNLASIQSIAQQACLADPGASSIGKLDTLPVEMSHTGLLQDGAAHRTSRAEKRAEQAATLRERFRIEDKSTDNDNHVTSHMLGNLKNYKIIERPPSHTLIGRPVLRQYYIGDTLHLEKHERKVTWDELFFDLVFVVVIAEIAHSLQTNFSNDGVEAFFLLFIPTWLVWMTATFYMNRSGSDNLHDKLYMFSVMCFSVGMGVNAVNAFALDPLENTGGKFATCFCLANTVHLLANLRCMYYLPKFRTSLALSLIHILLGTAPFVVSVFIADTTFRKPLWWTGITLSIGLNMLVNIFKRVLRRTKYRTGNNHEHLSERFGLFTIVVLGEVVVAFTDFDSATRHFNESAAACSFGLFVAVGFEWIYFHVEASRHYKHALRRHSITSFLWVWVHLPLHLCIVLTGTSMALLILKIGTATSNEMTFALAGAAGNSSTGDPRTTTYSERMFFASSFAATMSILALIGILHKSIESVRTGQSYIPKMYRILSRVLVGLVFFIVAAAINDDHFLSKPFALLFSAALLLSGQIALEEYGRLGKKTPPNPSNASTGYQFRFRRTRKEEKMDPDHDNSHSSQGIDLHVRTASSPDLPTT